MKLLGAVLILLACSGLGIMAGERIAARPRQLQKLRNDLLLLEMDINYAATPLPEALSKLVQTSDRLVRQLWEGTLNYLVSGEGLTAEEAWHRSLTGFSSQSALQEKDLAVLRDFGAGLGTTNRREQLKKFKLVQEQLAVLAAQAEETRQKTERIYRTMGVLTGIALIILLF